MFIGLTPAFWQFLIVERPMDVRRIISPTICHGIAGLLMICLRFAHESEHPLICQHIPLLVHQITQSFALSEQIQGLEIEFRNVSFTYPGRNPEMGEALRQVNFTIHAEESVALVGRNGAGKTTLIKLLTRLYEPDEGEILIGGRNIQEYDLTELRKHIGVIFQDYVNYYLTARENIGVGRVEEIENKELVIQAAHKSGADTFIEKLPQNYETTLGCWFSDVTESTQLSGGEWQKIALARAFMRDAHVLVLDEPTSALDAQAEYEVFKHFRALTAHKTAIFVSLRLTRFWGSTSVWGTCLRQDLPDNQVALTFL